MTYQFYSSCVSTPESEVPTLHRMIDDAIDITRKTFLQHVNRPEFAEMELEMGYCAHPSQGLTMAADWHVSYHRSHWKGVRCYYFRHSAIEYYFLKAA